MDDNENGGAEDGTPAWLLAVALLVVGAALAAFTTGLAVACLRLLHWLFY